MRCHPALFTSLRREWVDAETLRCEELRIEHAHRIGRPHARDLDAVRAERLDHLRAAAALVVAIDTVDDSRPDTSDERTADIIEINPEDLDDWAEEQTIMERTPTMAELTAEFWDQLDRPE